MRSKQTTLALVLLASLAVVAYGLFATSTREIAKPPASRSDSVAGVVADQRSLNTLRDLLRLPLTVDEAPLARDAFRLADKEMDLAYADAVRASARQFRDTTPEIRAMDERLHRAQDDLAADEKRIAQLTADAAAASGAAKSALNDRIALSKARLELDQDVVDDARQDLMRVGGDPQGRMQAIMEEHQASSKSADSTRIVPTVATESRGMVGHGETWWSLHQKEAQLDQAKTAAESAAVSFTKQHAELEKAAPPTDSSASSAGVSHDSSALLLRTTRRRAAMEKARARLDQHVDDQHKLADVYQRWMAVVREQQRTAINGVLRGIAFILVIALIGLLVDLWIERLLGNAASDRRRAQTMGVIVRVSLQAIGVLFVLLVIFGIPSNLGTFLGLAGAGLTVAMKDFIVSFFGWFVLLGKDGIGIGDLVEINGVTGEVREIGMFQTVLLETGNWTDSGHPTGRRVTFTNSFAIEGHYFNFSTSGQWLWDEVRIVVPAGRDPYPVVEALKKHIEAATSDSAAKAEHEWQGVARSPRLSALSAVPAINIKPVIGGVEITVRYLTHMRERSELRANLYHAAVDLLGEKYPSLPASTLPAPTLPR
ncbi:MAG: mechanosensitive ion channel domain-containing protein [bacterium]